MNSLQKIMYLSEAQKDELFTNGYIIVDGVRYEYNADTMYITPMGALNMGNEKITNLATPTANGDATNKGYVDSAITAAISDAIGRGY